VPRITYLTVFDQGGSERETGSIESERDSRWIQGYQWIRTAIPEFSGSLKFTCSHFLNNVTFCVNYVEFMFIMHNGNSCMLLFRSSGALSVEFRSPYGF